MADGYLNFDTKINTSGFNNGIKSVGKVAAGALTGITAALGGAAAYAIKVGSDFEAGMSEVGSISGAASDELEKLSDKAKEMGAKTKFSATEAASGLKYMAMAGWKTDDMLNGLEGVMNLAAASGEDLATTSDIVTDALTAFGLSASDSTHFADVLAQASSNANTNVSMMGATFKYVAPVAGAMGYSIEDCATAIGLMANSGIKAGAAGTSLRAILSKMAKPTDDARAAMESLGLSLTDSSGNMKTLDEVMGDLRKGFSGLSEAEQIEAATTIAGQEAMSGLLAIVNASDDDFNKLKDAIYNCNGAAESMATVMQDNLQGNITLLKSAAESLGVSIYESMEKPLNEAAKQATKYVSKMVDAFKNSGTSGLIEAGANIITDVAVGVAGQLPKLITLVASSVQSVATSLNKQLPKLLFAGKQIVLSLYKGAVAILPSLVSLAYNIVAGLAEEIAADAPLLVEYGTEMLGQLGSGLQEAIPELLANALPLIEQFTASLAENVGLLVDAGIQFIYNIVNGLVAALPSLIEYGPQIITNLASIINENVPKLIIAGASIIFTLITGIVQNIPNLIAHFPEMVKAIISVITAVNWLSLGKTIIEGIAKGIANLASKIPTAIKNIGQTAKSWMSSINWKSLGRDIIDLIKIGIESLVKAIPDALKSIGKSAMTAFKEMDWWSLGKNVVSGIASGITGTASSIADAAKRAAENALSAAKRLLGIKSPSRRARKEIGQMYGKGLELGILDKKDAVEKASEALADSAVKEIDVPDYAAIATMARNKVITSTALTGEEYAYSANSASGKSKPDEVDYNKLEETVLHALNKAKDRPVVLNGRQINRALKEEGIVVT